MFLGLDPAFPGRPATYALLDASPRLLSLGQTADVPALVEGLRPLVVAVDAPLFLPRGWGCLDWPCTCGRCLAPPTARREAELALASLGLGLFWTTKRSILRPLVEWAVALRRALEERGWRVIEVYPHAARVRLLGRPPARKGSRAGRAWAQAGLGRLVGGLPPPGESLLGHDALDAILAAYTGLLWQRGEAEALGDPQEGLIVVPAVAGGRGLC
jgi:predicted nuclease with RNAse H fold